MCQTHSFRSRAFGAPICSPMRPSHQPARSFGRELQSGSQAACPSSVPRHQTIRQFTHSLTHSLSLAQSGPRGTISPRASPPTAPSRSSARHRARSWSASAGTWLSPPARRHRSRRASARFVCAKGSPRPAISTCRVCFLVKPCPARPASEAKLTTAVAPTPEKRARRCGSLDPAVSSRPSKKRKPTVMLEHPGPGALVLNLNQRSRDGNLLVDSSAARSRQPSP